MDEWINQMWSVILQKYHSANEKNEVLIHATTWTSPPKHYAGQREPDAKGHVLCDPIYLTCSEQGNPARQNGGGSGERLLSGLGFPFGVMKKF